jgi:iron complex outermembrane receptor protein
MSRIRPIALGLACALTLVCRTASAQQTPPPPPPPAQQQADPVRIEENVVVSATKVEQQLINAPATITVIGPRTLDVAASQNYGDILRAVPGVNITQLSARDVNITPRGSTSTLSTNQLAVIDGRSLYQDFFGFVMWDFMPVNLNELKRIEVIRGPASAIWGANAVSGVVNVITKTPREMLGTSAAIGFGTFDRSTASVDADAGTLWYLNATHASAINDRAAFKVSAGYYTQDAFARPTGLIPNGGTTRYPDYENQGTQQPKVDARLDYSLDNGAYMTFSGGYSGTEGLMHSGIGPFDIESGSWMGYGKANYTKNAFRLQAFFNTLDGEAAQLLTRGPGGAPITFVFKTKTFDVEAGNVTTIGRNVLTYGGNLRHNTFDMSIATGAEPRTEGGIYAQDEIFLNEMLRLVAGARVDKFTSIDGLVVSPRVALLVKPLPDHSFRVSYNRAFRAPSAINNHIGLTIAEPLPFGAINPALAPLGTFYVPIRVDGNPELDEERLDAFEVGYSGFFGGRTTVSAAWYLNKFKDQILFTQTGSYGIAPPPPGFPAQVGPFPGALLWAGVYQAGIRFPSSYSYANFGSMTQQGLELGFDTAVNDRVNVYGNYSWQGEPDPEDFPLSELNIPAEHRFNAGLNFHVSRVLGTVGVSYVGEAFWQDVLDARYHGSTEAYTLVNGSVGVRFGARDQMQVMLKGTNLTNEEIQQHIFGDIIRRQLSGEFRITF